jgi:cytochrome P450
MPFGTGPRKCPGEPIAETELPLILSRLLLRFEFSSPEGAGRSVPMDEVLGLALEPARSLVRVARRSQPIALSTPLETGGPSGV